MILKLKNIWMVYKTQKINPYKVFSDNVIIKFCIEKEHALINFNNVIKLTIFI